MIQHIQHTSMDDISKYFQQYRLKLYDALASVDINELHYAFNILNASHKYSKTSRIFVCGNGGSASIAEHFSCDHSKGVRKDTSLTPEVISLSSNMALVTAIANDNGYEHIFSDQLNMHRLSATDIVVLISSSGNSANIVEAFKFALSRKSHIIAMVGFDGGKIAADFFEKMNEFSSLLHVKENNYGIVEDCHQILMHCLAQAIRLQHTSSLTSPL